MAAQSINLFAQAVTNSQRIWQEKDKYKLRQQIVEQPFGTIKRLPIIIGRGFDYVLLKGLKINEADSGLIFSTHNLWRILSIPGIPGLKKV